MEMMRGKMPTTIVLLVSSWFIAITGFITAAYLLVFKFSGVNSLLGSFAILLGSLFFAALVRMLSNIGQILFDSQNSMRKSTNEMKDVLNQNFNGLTQNIESMKDVLNQNFNGLTQNIESMKDSFDMIISDSKEIIRNVHQITNFFEEVEKE